jgi:hypothetical protein
VIHHTIGRDEDALELLAVAERERRLSDMPEPAAEAEDLRKLARDIRGRLGDRADAVAAGARYVTVEALLDRLETRGTFTNRV